MDKFVSNDEYEKNDSMENTQENTKVVSMSQKDSLRSQFAEWVVKGESMKLKLTTPNVQDMEKKYRKNLISLMGDEDNLPPLTTMLQMIHAAAIPWNHGIRLKDIENRFDSYLEEGGTQLSLYVDVYLQIFMVSGFFSKTLVEDMTDSLQDMQQKM